MPGRALIVEAGFARGALAGARALAAGGHVVAVASPVARGLAAVSRAATAVHALPSPAIDERAFVEGVAAAVREGRYDLVFAAGDAELLALSANRDGLGARLPHAPHAAVVRALDKVELARAAETVGLAVPAILSETGGWDGPVVVKARLHWTAGSRSARHEAVIAATREGALEHAAAVRAAGGEPVIQEVVSGRLVAWTGVVGAGGELLASVQQEALQLWPPRAGVTARGRTVVISPALEAGAMSLLDELGWRGLAELQFLVGSDGVPRLIDLNGRFYGSLQLAVAAGANLPAVWAADALGEQVPSVTARPGVTYQWLEGDLRAALASRRPGAMARVLPAALRATHSVWAARDPRPALRYLGAMPGRLGRRAA